MDKAATKANGENTFERFMAAKLAGYEGSLTKFIRKVVHLQRKCDICMRKWSLVTND